MPILARAGAAFSVPLKGAVVCCPEPGQDVAAAAAIPGRRTKWPTGYPHPITVPIGAIAALPWTGYPQNGWPFVSKEALEHFRDYGLNYTHIRTGPFTRDGEQTDFEGYERRDEKYDLAKFAPAFSQKLVATVEAARNLGIYVEVDLIDGWVLKHCQPGQPSTLSPWCAGQNLQGVADTGAVVREGGPKPHHEAWIRHVVGLTCSYANVFYQIGNETGVIHSVSEWEVGVYSIAKSEMQIRQCEAKLVGSNSDVRGTVDYRTYHEFNVPAPEEMPVLMNETDNRNTTGLELALRHYMAAARPGVYYAAWRGPMAASDWTQALELLKAGRPPAGHEAPSFGCPPQQGIRIKILQEPSPGKIVLDSTAYPEIGGEGADSTLRCQNIWNDSLLPRPLQDSAGPAWRLVSGKPGTMVERNFSNPSLAFLLFDAADPGFIEAEACSQGTGICGRWRNR
jgi:hypothetical protein